MLFSSFPGVVLRTLWSPRFSEGGYKQNLGAKKPPGISGTPCPQPAQKSYAWILPKGGAQSTMGENQPSLPFGEEGQGSSTAAYTAAKVLPTPFLPAVVAPDATREQAVPP